MKNVLFCILFLSASISSQASTSDSISVYGQVFDRDTHKQLCGVSVGIYTSDGDSIGADSTKNVSSPNFPQYFYSIKIGKEGRYKMILSKADYDSVSVDIDVPRRSDHLFPVPEMQLVKTKMLDDIVVRASKIIMVQKGDTVVYNADAILLTEGAMLETLIQQLPNTTIDANGRIMVNGHFVSELLLNGKDFVKGNAIMALKNLPAYVVDKLKVYQRSPENAYLLSRDSVEHLQDPWVMDVNIKRIYQKSWLVNADAAIGIPKEYLGQVFVLNATEKSHLFSYGNVNNLTNDMSPDKTGGWSANNSLASGLSKVLRFGIDYMLQNPNTKNKVNMQGRVIRISSDEREESSQTQFLPESDIFVKHREMSKNKLLKVGWRGDFTMPGRFCLLSANANIDYQKKDVNSVVQQAQLAEDMPERYRGEIIDSLFMDDTASDLQSLYVNKYRDDNQGNNRDWNAELNVSATLKPSFLRGHIQIQILDQYEHHSNESFSNYILRNMSGNDFRRKYAQEPSWKNRLNTNISYQLFHKGNFNTNVQYGFSSIRSFGERGLYRLDSLGGEWADATKFLAIDCLPSTRDSMSLCTDQKNSYHSENWKTGNSIGLNFNYMKAGKWMAMLTLPVRFQSDRIEDFRDQNFSKEISRYVSFEPLVTFTTFDGLRLSYRMNVLDAPMGYKITYEDDSNPLFIVEGNPRLKNSVIHQASIQYSKFEQKRLRNFSTYTGIVARQKAIARRRLYEKETGVVRSIPDNVDGNWSIESTNTYSQVVDRNGYWRIAPSLNLRYLRSVDYISETTSESAVLNPVNNFKVGTTIQASWRKKTTNVSLFSGVQWNHVSSELAAFNKTNSFDLKYGVSAVIKLPYEITASTNLTFYQRRGYLDKTMDDNNLVWNASLERRLSKDGRWMAKVEGVDILGQLSNVSTFVNSQGITETWRNVVPSYGLLHVIYRFNTPQKRAAQ